MFTTEPNNFQLWGADDENAYIQTLTKKLCIVAGLEAEDYKSMFLLYTRHSMVQDLEEHVGMTRLLTLFNQ